MWLLIPRILVLLNVIYICFISIWTINSLCLLLQRLETLLSLFLSDVGINLFAAIFTSAFDSTESHSDACAYFLICLLFLHFASKSCFILVTSLLAPLRILFIVRESYLNLKNSFIYNTFEPQVEILELASILF